MPTMCSQQIKPLNYPHQQKPNSKPISNYLLFVSRNLPDQESSWKLKRVKRTTISVPKSSPFYHLKSHEPVKSSKKKKKKRYFNSRSPYESILNQKATKKKKKKCHHSSGKDSARTSPKWVHLPQNPNPRSQQNPTNSEQITTKSSNPVHKPTFMACLSNRNFLFTTSYPQILVDIHINIIQIPRPRLHKVPKRKRKKTKTNTPKK
jgi:hypothetical protein